MEKKIPLIEDELVTVPTMEEPPITVDDDANKVDAEISKILVAEQQPVKRKSIGKKLLLILLFITLNATVILSTIVTEFAGDKKPAGFLDAINTFFTNWPFLFLAVLMFAFTLVFEALKRYIFIKVTLKKKLPLISFNSALMCKYYDNVTPLGSGGQPFEIYYLRKKGLPIGISSGIPIMCYIVNRIAFAIVVLTVLIFHGFGDISLFLKILCIVGVAMNMVIPGALIFFSILPKIADKAASLISKIAKKLHLTKDEQQFKSKLVGSITEYTECIKYFVHKSKTSFILGIVFSLLSLVALYSVPFFVIQMCGKTQADWWQLFSLCVICYTVVLLLPTPGNSGGAEMSFYSIFNKFLSDNLLMYGMLSWRIVTYYLYIVSGLILILGQQIYKLTPKGKAERQIVTANVSNTEILYNTIMDNEEKNEINQLEEENVTANQEQVVSMEEKVIAVNDQPLKDENANNVVEVVCENGENNAVSENDTTLQNQSLDEKDIQICDKKTTCTENEVGDQDDVTSTITPPAIEPDITITTSIDESEYTTPVIPKVDLKNENQNKE